MHFVYYFVSKLEIFHNFFGGRSCFHAVCPYLCIFAYFFLFFSKKLFIFAIFCAIIVVRIAASRLKIRVNPIRNTQGRIAPSGARYNYENICFWKANVGS